MIARIDCGNVRWVVGERVQNVCVHQNVVAVHLNARGHWDFVVARALIEVFGYVQKGFVFLNFPLAVKQSKLRTIQSIIGNLIRRRKRNIVRSRI